MDNLLYQLSLINIFIRDLGDWLLPVMRFVTDLGSEQFFLLIVPLLYWVVDARTGLRVGVMLVLSNMFNGVFKLLLHQPRPFWVNQEVETLAEESSFGMPSGHAQNAMAIWGVLASAIRKNWATVLIGLVIFLTGISRLYLGIHFLTDVVFGWLIGALLLLLFLRYEQRVIAWFQNLSGGQQYGFALGSSLAFLALIVAIVTLNRTWSAPAEWVANYKLAYPDLAFEPYSLKGSVNIAGLYLGMLGGLTYLWRTRQMHQVSGSPGSRVLQFLIGMVGTLVIWAGLDMLFPDGETLVALVLRYIRYALLGLWVVALAPLVFKRLPKQA